MTAQVAPISTPDIFETTDTLQFRDPNQPNLHLAFWKRTDTSSKQRGANVLVWIHGLGDHSGRYRELVNELFAYVPQLDGVASYDQRGHGLSQGKRGGVYALSELVEDFVEHVGVRLVMEFGEEVNVLVGGHSLGGLVCAKSMQGKDWIEEGGYGKIRGLFLSAPCIEVVVSGMVNRMMAPMAQVLGRVPGVKGWIKDNGIRRENLTHCPKRQEEILQDKLYHNMIGVGLGADLLSAGGVMLKEVKETSDEECMLKSVPLLIVQGELDPVSSVEGSKKLVEAAGDKAELVLVSRAFHEVHNEDEEHGRGEFVKTCASFLRKVFEGGEE